MENMSIRDELKLLKDKIDYKNGICLDEGTLDWLSKKFDECNLRTYKGIQKYIDTRINELFECFNKVNDDNLLIIKMLEDKGFVADDPKLKEIEEYMAKIKSLMR